MMRFPPEFIDRLRHGTTLSQVIGKRLAIKKHGREFHALCPFHKEKSPSFTINDEKGFYHCFGCGAHGDAIGFLKEYERLSYPEAVEKLAGELGIAVPESSPEAQAAYRRVSGLQEICEEAALWFQRQLMSPAASAARSYLTQRGISQEMIAQFRLGFSLPERDGLKQYMLKKGISEPQLIEAGLIIKPDEGATYDRFRARLMFPISDARGRVVAFGGRILPNTDTGSGTGAKYLNSPETPIFKKGELLYGLHHARRTITERETVLVAEGYLDVIALHQAGLSFAVAPLGTAITIHQLQWLWRVVAQPVLCLDGDSAGQRAMMRAAELVLPHIKAGQGLKFALLPSGEDPDSLIQKRGVSAMQSILSQALNLSETLWRVTAAEVGTKTPEQRAMLDSRLQKITDQMTDKILKQHMRDYFYAQMRSLDKPTPYSKATLGKSASGYSGKPSKPSAPSPAVSALAGQDTRKLTLSRLEEQLVGLVLSAPDIMQESDIEEYFASIELSNPLLDNIRQATLERIGQSDPVNREQLLQWLERKGLLESASRLLQRSELSIKSSGSMLTHVQAVERFKQVLDGFHRYQMEVERTRVLGDVDAWSDSGRLMELGKQKDQMRRVAHFILPEE